MSTFTVKQLRFTFTLGTNARFQGNNNTLQITGLRATADVVYPGPPSYPTADIRIYGMKMTDMQALTGLTFQTLTFQRNSVLVETNDGVADPTYQNGWVSVFAGQLITVVPDFSQMPDVALQITAQTLGYDLLNPATPTSFPPGVTFEQTIRTIALKMSQDFANEGVTGAFPGATYWSGTPADQLRQACKKAGIVYYTDSLGLISIGLPGAVRNLPSFTLTKQSGLIGNPTLNSVNLIGVDALFNPAFRPGAPLTIQDSLQTSANGNWKIYDLKHALSSLMPEGPWFTRMTAMSIIGYGVTPP
jgi:hypothetical protein